MPKVVDHGARRRQLADAVMRLAAREGLASISLRHVAAEAGVSMGLVQHYFGSKDEMFAFAISVVSERVQHRLEQASGRLQTTPEPRASVEMLLREMLPLDEPRRVEGHVGLAYQAYSATRPALSAGLREGTAQLRSWVAEQVVASGAAEAAAAQVLATGLVALVEGLSMHVLTGNLPVAEAKASFAAALDAAFTPRLEEATA